MSSGAHTLTKQKLRHSVLGPNYVFPFDCIRPLAGTGRSDKRKIRGLADG